MFKESQIWDSTKEPSLIVCSNCGDVLTGIWYIYCSKCRENPKFKDIDNLYSFDETGGTLIRKSKLIPIYRNEKPIELLIRDPQ